MTIPVFLISEFESLQTVIWSPSKTLPTIAQLRKSHNSFETASIKFHYSHNQMLHWYSKSPISFPAGCPNFCTRHQKSWAKQFRCCGVLDKHFEICKNFVNSRRLSIWEPGRFSPETSKWWTDSISVGSLLEFLDRRLIFSTRVKLVPVCMPLENFSDWKTN